MTRRQARDIVFKLIYQEDMQGFTQAPVDRVDEMITVFAQCFDADYAVPESSSGMDWSGGVNADYMRNTLRGILGSIPKLDGAAAELSHNWDISRVSRLTLAALRYGMYEIGSNRDVPASVAINEVTNLISTYEGEQAANYVNGVLARYNRDNDNRD